MKADLEVEIEAGHGAAARAGGQSPDAYLDGVLSVPAKPRPPGRNSLAQLFADSPLKGLSLTCSR
jgi:hypothetical protein